MGKATNNIWDSYLRLVSLSLIFVLLTFAYLMFQDEIKSAFAKPKYDKEELAKAKQNRKKKQNEDWNYIKNGIHVQTGLKNDKNLKYVLASCLTCHSSKLITQNSATREGWQQMIKWMQATQGLQKLGDYEPKILDYLAKHYAPKDVGRRQNLDMSKIKWYVLEME